MANEYDAAVMALPEREEELFEKINKATAERRKEWEEQVEEAQRTYAAKRSRQAQRTYAAKRSRQAQPASKDRDKGLERWVGTIARALVGVLFVGGIARGWCTVEFGLIGALVCGIWALARWRRK